jgi:hypothetical protein
VLSSVGVMKNNADYSRKVGKVAKEEGEGKISNGTHTDEQDN